MTSLKNKIIYSFLAIAVISVLVPFTPIMPSSGLDPSWVLGMNQSYSQGLVFGKDVIFTFGPYSSIYTKAFHPETDSLMIFGSLYLAAMFCYVAYQNLKNSKIYVVILFIAVISAVLYSRDVLLFLYPFMVAIYILDKLYGELDEVGAWSEFEWVMLLSAFGLLPLIKGSIIFLCAAIIFLGAVMMLIARRNISAFILCISPVVSLLLFWAISGQPLDAIPQYFISMMPIISGYTEAMAVNGRSAEVYLYIVTSLVILVGLFISGGGGYLKKIYLLVVTGLILFLAFKAGFVRHDGHAINAALTLLLVCLLLARYLNGMKLYAILFLSFTTWFVIHENYHKVSVQILSKNFVNTYEEFWSGVVKRVINPNGLNREYEKRLSEIALNFNIRKIEGSVDVYSYDQANLIASGNNWSPRPILQSYSVYTPELSRKNSDYLKGSGAPDVLLIKIQPIDGRLPSLEDGASWPIIYSNYAFEEYNGGFLGLRKKEEKPVTVMDVGVKRNAMLGEDVIVDGGKEFVYAKIKITKTFVGKIISFIFKPSELKITINLKSGEVKTYRFIAGMAESGFIISPLVESETDFILAYSGDKYLKNKKVKSFKIEPVNFNFIWKGVYNIELTDFEFEYMDSLNFIGPTNAIGVKSISALREANRCDGTIDEIDGTRVNSSSNTVGALMRISGWLAPSIDTGERYESAYAILENKNGEQEYFELDNMLRPDVSLVFKRNLDYVGFKSMLNLSAHNGDYFLRLAYKKKNVIYICPKQNYSLKIENE